MTHLTTPKMGREASRATVIRQEYAARFPAILQRFITSFTGKAAVGELPGPVLSARTYSLLGIAQWPAIILVGCSLLIAQPVWGWLALPCIWLVAVNGLRKAHAVISHHAVHREITRSWRGDYWIQVIASAESFAHSWEDYFEAHVKGHHSRKMFTTAADPDAALLLILGFRPGMPVRQLWRLLVTLTFSPRLHWLFIKVRWNTNFVTAPWHRRFVSAAFLLAAMFVAWAVPPAVFVAVVLVPLFPLYNASALWQFTSEHAWLVTEEAAASPDDYADRCWARFCLQELPAEELRGWGRLSQWSAWWSKMILVHLPVRYGVLAGDLPVHDFHHLVPAEHDWTRVFWSRQESIESGDRYRMAQREFCSLGEALTKVFEGLSRRGTCDEPGE